MKVGIVNEEKRMVLSEFREHFILYNFSISMEELDFFKIFHSAFSTPARYVMELFRRLSSVKDGPDEGCFVFNPLLTMDSATVFHVLSDLVRLKAELPGAAVFTDGKNVPLGYLLPASIREGDVKFLSLLSTVDGKKDEEVLRNLLFVPVSRIAVDGAHPDRSFNNKFFYNEGYHHIYEWTTDTALGAMKRLEAGAAGAGPLDRKKLRDSIPFAAIMPYHAGDLLFFCIAFKNIETHFTKILVNKAYLDIVTENAPGIEPLISVLKPPSFAGNNIREESHFLELVKGLPQGNFYYFCRSSSDYNMSKFHLIDHFAFALGEGFIDKAELVSRRKTSPQTFRPEAGGPMRVFFHFDGGWPLKVYPMELQKRLIEMFCSADYEVTVLAGRDEVFACEKNVRFKDMGQLRELLKTHHIVIGMDSFPCHYSAHVLGIPTVCLFANTRPENSDAAICENYVYMEKGLDCRPCGLAYTCPKNNGKVCANFAEPGKVFEQAAAMVNNIYKRNVL